MAADVCKALGYSGNTRQAVEDHVNDADKCFLKIGLRGSPPLFVTESGLFALILGSKLPSAKVFKHWVTSVVLPAIRKDGMYVMGEEKVSTGEMTLYLPSCSGVPLITP